VAAGRDLCLEHLRCREVLAQSIKQLTEVSCGSTRTHSWCRWGGMLAENALHIYTDGSSLPAPRRGGIGIRFLLIDSQGREEITDSKHPGYKGATNNQMELQASIEPLRKLATWVGDLGLQDRRTHGFPIRRGQREPGDLHVAQAAVGD